MFVTTDAYLLQLLRDGKVDAEIAVRLQITRTALQLRIDALCRSAGVVNRDELRAWIETVDTAEYELIPAAEIVEVAIPGAPPPPRYRRTSPIVVRTAASMAAAMLGLAGLVSMNTGPSTQPLTTRGVTILPAATVAPAMQAAVSVPIGPDLQPERALVVTRSNEAQQLPPGVTMLVELRSGDRTTGLELVTGSDDGSLARLSVLSAPSDGVITSTATLPNGEIMFSAVCQDGECDSTSGAGNAWTTFYRSDDGGATWMRHSQRDGRWTLIGIDDGRYVASRADGAWTPVGSEHFAGQQLVQWHQKLATVASTRIQLAGSSEPRPILARPMGAGGQVEGGWWMRTETAITWTPQFRPGSTYYTGIYGSAYGNPIAEFESVEPLEVRGRLGDGRYAANRAGEAVIVTAADGTLAPIAGLAPNTRILMVIPE